MHILYLHQYFVPPDGSGGTRSFEMARRLVAAGHRVTLITSSAFFPSHYTFDNKTTFLEIEGIQLRIIDIPYSNRLSYASRMLAFIRFALLSAMEVVRADNVDVVFATSTPLTIAIPGVIAKRKHKCPMVFEVRDLWPEMPIAIGALRNPLVIKIARMLENWAYSNSDHIIALSPGMKNGVVQTDYPEPKVSVVPNSCDVALFRTPSFNDTEFWDRYPFLKGGPLIAYTGTFGLINGVDYLVDIAAEMAKINPSVRFVIAGDGKQKHQVLAHARNRGVLEKNFWIIPPVPKKEIPNLLSVTTVATSVVVDLPELWHNSANKFFDALAAGRPIMINHAGWQAEVLTSTGAGLVVPPSDPSVAASMLHEFISDTERLKNAEIAAANLAINVFDRDLLFESLHNVFRNLYKNSST